MSKRTQSTDSGVVLTETVVEPSVDEQIEIAMTAINESMTSVNRLNGSIYMSKKKQKEKLETYKDHLDKLYASKKKSIELARPYIDARKQAKEAEQLYKQAQLNLSLATQAKSSAVQQHDNASKSVESNHPAETLVGTQGKAVLEALNRVSQQVLLSTKEYAAADALATERLSLFKQSEENVLMLEKQHKKAIRKADIYFKMKVILEQDLDAERHRQTQLQQKLEATKQKYLDAFAQLQEISSKMELRKAETLMAKVNNGSNLEEEDDKMVNLPDLEDISEATTSTAGYSSVEKAAKEELPQNNDKVPILPGAHDLLARSNQMSTDSIDWNVKSRTIAKTTD